MHDFRTWEREKKIEFILWVYEVIQEFANGNNSGTPKPRMNHFLHFSCKIHIFAMSSKLCFAAYKLHRIQFARTHTHICAQNPMLSVLLLHIVGLAICDRETARKEEVREQTSVWYVCVCLRNCCCFWKFPLDFSVLILFRATRWLV